MRRLAYALIGVIVLAAGALIAFGPALVDTPAVRAEIQGRLSAALQGQVSWETLQLRLFPAPHGELRALRIDIPGKLAAAADEVKVDLRLWPLLRGSAELSSVVVRKPSIELLPSGEASEDALDAVALYRKVVPPVVDALRSFAPDTELRVEKAAFADLREVDLVARTGLHAVDLEFSAASPFWKRLTAKGRLEYQALAAQVQVEVDGLLVDTDVPPAQLRAQLRAGPAAIEGDFHARIPALAAAQAKVVLPEGKPPHASVHASAIDLAQALSIVRRKLPGLEVIESAQGHIWASANVTLASQWQAEVEITKSNGAVKLAPLPWAIGVERAHIAVSEERIQVAGARGRVGDSTFEHAAAEIVLGKTPALTSASASAALSLEQWLPWLATKAPLEEIDGLSGKLDVTLKRLALRFDRPQDVDFDALAVPRAVSAKLKALPGALRLDGGQVAVGPKLVRIDKVMAQMLDARTSVSGTVSLKKPGVEVTLSGGTLGEKALRWALAQAEVPARLEPKTPLTFAAQRIAWAPDRPLEADARIEFDGGPQLGVALAWRPERLELRRVTIKDARSDATFGATVAGDLIQASFSGTLAGATIPAMLREAPPAGGVATGELRVTIDRKQPERTQAEGKLAIQALDLGWLTGKKSIVERAELMAERDGGRITGARFGWEDQFFELSGQGRRTSEGPVLEARIVSDGVMLERLLPPADPNAPRKKSSALWPLPVSGRVELSAGFVQYKEHRIEPLEGVLTLEPKRARIAVKRARMCGVSFPMELEFEPDSASAAAHVSIENEPLERTMRCLTGGELDMTGTATLKAELRTVGRRPHLVRGLAGTVEAEVRDGRVKKFALLGNILAFRGIASLEDMKSDGFPYRRMSARGRFDGGRFRLEEGFFDSPAARLAASGDIDLLGANSHLTVLVAPLANIERVVGAIPLLGDVFGGTMVALPIAVNGDIRDPVIVPLGPRAVTDQLLGIFERTLKLPGKLVPAP